MTTELTTSPTVVTPTTDIIDDVTPTSVTPTTVITPGTYTHHRVNSKIDPSLQLLHTSYKFASTSHFLSLFQKPLKIVVETTHLEYLITYPALIQEMKMILVNLIKSVSGNRHVSEDTWDTHLAGLCTKWGVDLFHGKSVDQETDDGWMWESASLVNRIDVLYWLCEWHFYGAERLRYSKTEDDMVAWVHFIQQ
jgi:hypothetical protein